MTRGKDEERTLGRTLCVYEIYQRIWQIPVELRFRYGSPLPTFLSSPPQHLLSESLYGNRDRKACCCQSNTPTLILKRWKSCCLSLSSLFVSPQRLFTPRLSPSSTSLSLVPSFSLRVLTRSSTAYCLSAVKESRCRTCEEYFRIYVSICV